MTRTRSIRVGSRGSALALWQANWVKNELESAVPGVAVAIEVIKTTGDRILDSPLSAIGDKGLFTREIEHSLLEGRIDAAVHSLKDLPTELPSGLTIGAVTRREDVHDVFLRHPNTSHRGVEDVPSGGTIATGSLRRVCQLLHWRPDLRIVDLRGNLNTRFSRLDASDWDGMILARAGVLRLGLAERITQVLPFEHMLPAVGQGSLAIEIRENDRRTLDVVRPLGSEAATRSTLGERALLRYLEGGCQVPIGAYGRIENNQFVLDAMIGSLDGSNIVRGRMHGDPEQSEEIGRRLAAALHEGGGGGILDAIRTMRPPSMEPA